MLAPDKAYFTTAEVMRLLGITKSELFTLLRPVRSQGRLLPPIFTPEAETINKLAPNTRLFTQRDILKMKRYFKALKEYKAAREELRSQGAPDRAWLADD